MMRRMRAWNRYWFRPGFLVNLAICRIVCVVAQLALLILADVYNYKRLLELSSLPDSFYKPIPIVRIFIEPFGWHSPLSYEILLGIYGVTIAAGILALVGFKSNLSLLLFALGNILMQAYSYSFGDLHHPEALLIIMLSLLAVSPAGKVLSIDDLKSRVRENTRLRRLKLFNKVDKKSTFARWPLTLVLYMFALIYLNAAVHKLTKTGLDWMNGYTLQYYLIDKGLRRGSDIGVWLGQQHILAWILSWVTIVFESTFFLMLIFPILSWIYIPVGLALHTGMCVTGVACFYQYLALYTVFIPWVPLLKVLKTFSGTGEIQRLPKPEILYDGKCLLCIRSMTTIHYFDWFERLAFSDIEGRWPSVAGNYPEVSMEDCEREIHLLLPDGSVRKGFFAFRKILGYLPLAWPFVAPLYLPGSSTIGPKLYRWIASRRSRFHGCSAEGCSSIGPGTASAASSDPAGQ